MTCDTARSTDQDGGRGDRATDQGIRLPWSRMALSRMALSRMALPRMALTRIAWSAIARAARSRAVWPRLAWPLEILTVVVSNGVYERIRAGAPRRAGLAHSNADLLVSAEPGPIVGLERWLNQLDATHSGLAHLTGYYYFTLHLPVTATILVWLWWRRPHQYAMARTALMLMTYSALAFFWLFPVAPPRLATPGAFDTLATLQLGTEPGQTHGLVNQYAAFPSLHVAWAVWCAWALATTLRGRWRRLWYLYPLVTSYVVIATANHYLIDAIAGLLAFGLAVAVLPDRSRAAAEPDQSLASAAAASSAAAAADWSPSAV